MMTQSDVIRTSVDGVLRGAQIVKRDPQPDGSCIVTMTAPLGGKFATAVYGQVFQLKALSSARSPIGSLAAFVDAGVDFFIPKAMASDKVPVPDWRQAYDKLSARVSTIEDLLAAHPAIVDNGDKMPTGLVLDARGSNFIPSMSPKIRELRGAYRGLRRSPGRPRPQVSPSPGRGGRRT